MDTTRETLCGHCHRPYSEHQRIEQPLHKPSFYACPTTFFAPRCPMCCRYSCRCADIFTPKGHAPPC